MSEPTARRSVWTAMTRMLSPPPLASDLTADACIVGAGVAGMTTAYVLAKAGRKVVVLDDGPVGGGMTCMTTAHLASAVDDRFYELERLHGEDGARLWDPLESTCRHASLSIL